MGKVKARDPMKNRRFFGNPGGKQSRKYRMRQKAAMMKIKRRVAFHIKDKTSYPSYQLVRKQTISAGSPSTKFVVRRIPVNKDRNSKLLKQGPTSLKFTYNANIKPISGNRIINLDLLKSHIVEITTHSCLCVKAQEVVSSGKDPVVLKSEICRNGLCSIILAECQGCKKQFQMQTSSKANNLFDINVRAVWGSVASGGGATDLNEVLAAMNIPQMSEQMFTNLENKIGSWWEESVKDEMAKAGAEERRLAVERGNFHEGVPAITVICDGGWSKRTHKHSYNAFGGVGVIFGAATQKLLYIGVRNKQCVLCDKAQREKKTPKVHNCYKNWNDSSQAMEADIILCGFLDAESSHGLRYTKIIADGDSSVYSQLQEHVPVWGRHIVKLECANHTCKCIRSNLERLVSENPHYKGKGKLTKVNRIRLSTAVRCAIKMRSTNKDAKQLRRDILNSVYHILGFHSMCSDFCTKRQDKDNIEDEDMGDNEEFTTSFDEIFDEQYKYWKVPSEAEMEESRLAFSNRNTLIDLKEMIADVQVILNRVADKSERLIGNFTTNLAESWMGIRAKFDGGKVINRCGRGSWHTRCYGGALRKNLGVAWSPLTFQTVTGTPAGIYFYQGARKQALKRRASMKYKLKPESKNVRRKRKLHGLKESCSKKAKLHYGSQLNDAPDVPEDKLSAVCKKFFNRRVQKNVVEMEEIKKKTVDQTTSQLWKQERHIRVTSSNFGKIMKRRTSNVSDSLVRNMLYTKFRGNIYTIRGLEQESNTIIEYKNQKTSVTVEKVGLQICSKHPFLAASTDGLVTHNGESGLLEIKNFLQTNKYLLKEAVKKVPNFCLELYDSKLRLKQTHEIYYQVQGQLNIFGKDWCDFVIRRTNPYDMHIERVYRNQILWNTQMVPKLEAFYFKFVLPELALPRYGTYTGIRKPKCPWFDEGTAFTASKKSCLQRKRRTKNHEQSKIEHQSTNKTVLQQPSCSSDSFDEVTTVNTSKKTLGEKKSTTKRCQENVQSVVEPSNSDQQSTCTSVLQQPSCSSENVSVSATCGWSRRSRNVKFVGRKIIHEWCVEGKKKKTKSKWYSGIVLDVVKGKDGDPKTVYEVMYEGDDVVYEIDHLYGDFMKGSVKFSDI